MNACTLFDLVSSLQSQYAHLTMRQVAGELANGPGLLVVDRRPGLTTAGVLSEVYFMSRTAFLSRSLARCKDEAPQTFASEWELVVGAIESCRMPRSVVVAFVSQEGSYDVSVFSIEAPETLHPVVLALPVVLN